MIIIVNQCQANFLPIVVIFITEKFKVSFALMRIEEFIVLYKNYNLLF